MTPEGQLKLREELQNLKEVEMPQVVKDIATARDHGDLSENAEYHAAKERQGQVEARIRMLDDKLARAQVIETANQDSEQVRFGTTVSLEDAETGERMTYTIVGEDEADANEGLISVTSPVGRALLGKEPGDNVQVRVPKGTRELEILEVR